MLIQKMRVQRGWSQQQLADLSGLSVRTIQRIENGNPASMESLKSLAAVFEVDFQSLSGDTAMPHEMTATSFSEQPYPQDAVATARASREEEEAFAHVAKLKRFYASVGVYIVVVSVLGLINLWSNPTHYWALWVALGWGLILLKRAIPLFLGSVGVNWEKRQIEKRLGRKL